MGADIDVITIEDLRFHWRKGDAPVKDHALVRAFPQRAGEEKAS